MAAADRVGGLAHGGASKAKPRRHETIRSQLRAGDLRPRGKAGVVSMATTVCQNSLSTVTFNNGIEVIAKPADRQPTTAAA